MGIAPGAGGGRNEQGKEARGARPRPARRPATRRRHLPDRVQPLEFGQLRFNLEKEGRSKLFGK